MPHVARRALLSSALGGAEGASMVRIAAIGLACAIVKGVGTTASSWAEAALAGEVGARLRMQVLDGWLGLHGLRGTRHDDHGSRAAHAEVDEKRALASMTAHVHEVERGVAHGALVEARAALALAPLVVVLFAWSPDLAGGGVLALAGFALTALLARGRLKRAGRASARHAESTVALADEIVRHADVFTVYDAVPGLRAHLVRLGTAAVDIGARARALTAVLASTSEVAGALALLLVLVAATRGWLGAGVSLASVAPFAVAFFMAYKPLRELTEARATRARAEAALEALGGLVGEPQPADVGNSRAASAREPRVLRLSGVRARHGRHAPLTVDVAPGAFVAVVGPTGVGKSSLLRGLLGVDALAEGHVSYDGASIDGAPAGSARPFAWVPQDAPLLAATIEDNVWLGREAPSAAATREVLERVGAGRLARELVGTGLRLTVDRAVSGGERQWICMARAVASGAPVILMDEPSASLDVDAEAALLEAIERLRGERTLVLVTHRPGAAMHADVIVRLAADGASSAQGRDVEGRAEGDLDLAALEHVAVEHPGPGRVEAEPHARRERVDALTE
ncbi:MAG: ATP-binding cassette domain-containing protein [Myxococcales bacterium]|nr:ATP-binding cassette domain-containing protein [Myxococcales bacterium]